MAINMWSRANLFRAKTLFVAPPLSPLKRLAAGRLMRLR